MASKQRPLVGVANIVARNGRVLLCKRIGKHANGYYGFPGGHLEMYESIEECAAREMKEECGLEVPERDIRFWTLENVIFPDEQRHYVTVFTCTLWQPYMGEPKNLEPKKHEDWQWYYWREMPRPVMPGIAQLHDKSIYPTEVVM